MKKFLSLSLILLVPFAFINAQQKPILLNGQMLNAETLEPITIDTYHKIEFMNNGMIGVQHGPAYVWGAIDYEGNTLIKPRYKSKLYFSEGIAIGMVSGLGTSYEVINEKGEEIWDMNTRGVGYYHNGLAKFTSPEYKIGVVDKKGKVIIKPVYDDYSTNVQIGKNYFIVVKKGDHYGVINQKNKEILPFKYDDIRFLKDAIFLLLVPDAVNPETTSSFGSKIKNKDYGLWSATKGMIKEPVINHIQVDADFLAQGWLKVRPSSLQNKLGLIDLNGDEVLKAEYDNITYVSNNLVAVGKRDSQLGGHKWGLSDLQGNLKIDYLLNRVGKLSNDLIPICMSQNNQYGCGYVNANGQLQIQMNYTAAGEFKEGDLAQVGRSSGNSGSAYGLINKKNEVILPLVYGKIEKISTKHYKVNFRNNSYEHLLDATTMEPLEKNVTYIHRAYASYYYEVRDYQNAIKYFKTLYDQGKHDSDELQQMGTAYSRSGQYEEALKYINMVLNTPPGKMTDRLKSVRGEKAYALWKQGKTQEAKATYEETFANATKNMIEEYSNMRLEFAEMLAEMDLGNDAIAQYNEVLMSYPNAWGVYDKLGVLQLTIDYKDESITSFTESIRLNANGKDAYFYRGQAYSLKKEHAKAITDYEKAIQLDGSGQLTTIHGYLADSYFDSGSKEKGCGLWKQMAPYDERYKTKAAEHCK